MTVKWGSTICTVIKWGSTTCTAVYWGSTKVFPGYANSIVVTGYGSSTKFTITFNSGQTWAQRFPYANGTYNWKVSGSGASAVLYTVLVNTSMSSIRFNTYSGATSGTRVQYATTSTYGPNTTIPTSNFTTNGGSPGTSSYTSAPAYNTDP